MAVARQALTQQTGEPKQQLERALQALQTFDIVAMKDRYRADHYQIFVDYPTDFTDELPMLINGFFQFIRGRFSRVKR